MEPEGREVAVMDSNGRVQAWPLERGGAPRDLARLAAGETLLRWPARGTLIVGGFRSLAGSVSQIDLASGRRTRLHELSLRDPSGVLLDPFLAVSADARSYAYSVACYLNAVYLVTGLR